MNILILGGTGDAVLLAHRLSENGHTVTSSLAGLTKNPTKTRGKSINGGFGGALGLTEYLIAKRVDFLIDATHPFAQTMSANAVEGAKSANVPMMRLTRPGFEEPQGANWWHAETIKEAVALLPPGAGVLLTLGRQSLEAFVERKDVRFLVRSIEKPEISLPENFITVQARPPFSRGDEIVLMKRNGITHLVAKDSGSDQTKEKLSAAFMLRVQTIMVKRPTLTPSKEATSIGEIEKAIAQLPAPKRRFFFLP